MTHSKKNGISRRAFIYLSGLLAAGLGSNPKSLAQDLSNKSYDYKLNTYKKDGSSKITNGTTDLSVSKFNKWNADAIEKRQKALAVEAKKIWGF